MPRMLMNWEAAEIVRQKTGIRLETTRFTSCLLLDEGHYGEQYLYGPYHDKDVEDNTRVMVVYTLHHNLSPNFQLLVLDCEGDFLNSGAEGAEKYDVGVVHV